jgi:aminobenzoyl-glutamate utilization protein B
MIATASRCIAGTIVDLLTRPDLRQAARSEFERRTGGGVGGKDWIPPLLERDFRPPIDYRWPEYVTTARGEEWWNPASADE